MPHIHVSHFVLTSFSDALVTFFRDQVTSITTNVKHSVRTTGSEHQGQTSISNPDFNLGFACIFSSGMQEEFIFTCYSSNSEGVKNKSPVSLFQVTS